MMFYYENHSLSSGINEITDEGGVVIKHAIHTRPTLVVPMPYTDNQQ